MKGSATMTDINKEYEKEYYDEYRNNYYNPDDDDGEPGINLNWKRIQKGFHNVAGNNTETAETISGMQVNIETLNTDVYEIKESVDDLNTAVETAEQAAAAASASEAAAEAAQAAIEDIAESIPADYTALTNDVTDLKSHLRQNITLTDNSYIRHDTGAIGYNYANTKRSDYVFVIPGAILSLSGYYDNSVTIGSMIGLAFYDQGKAYISGVHYDGNAISVVVPDNAFYVRYTVYVGSADSYMLMVNDLSEQYRPTLTKSFDYPYAIQSTVQNNFGLMSKGLKKTDGYTMEEGKYVNTSGSVVSVAYASLSGGIDASEIIAVYTYLTSSLTISFYDEYGGFLGYINDADNTSTKGWAKLYALEKPNKTKYIRFSNVHTMLPDTGVYLYTSHGFASTTMLDVVNRSHTNILDMYDHINCIGDSLTWSQVWTSDNAARKAYKTYPQVLASLCGAEVSTFATPGDSAILWWERSSSGAFDISGLYIVFLGTNGGLTDTIDSDCIGTNPDAFASTNTGQYGRILQTIKNNGDKAVLIKPYAGQGLATTMEVVDKFGVKYNFPVIKMNNDERLNMNYHYFPDKTGSNLIHFNELGYAWMACEIMKQINALSPDEQFLIMREH